MHIFDPLIQQLAFNDVIEVLLYIAGSILSVLSGCALYFFLSKERLEETAIRCHCIFNILCVPNL